LGLLLSGAFISFSIIRYGVDKFRTEIVNGPGSDVKIGKWYNVIIAYLIPLQVTVLIVWWLIESANWDPEWWNPFHAANVGTSVLQWAIALAVFVFFNKSLVKYTIENGE
jgi:NSS family neurotransmitter:Na+ symporter